ncbi:response regulator transcription factor [Pelagimonas sp. KU-00592-HH]|uniref:response regulator transcription factor n=1 Tax=Pelagimonas sp. KU-00592-HH TaxID=3127651 RepID=UPI00310745D2
MTDWGLQKYSLKVLQMKKVQVLLIDDDIDLSEEVAEMMGEQGFEVTFARTIHQFHKATSQIAFDLYVVDLLLPDGHGHELIRQIRRTSEAGIVVLSGKLDEVDKVVALELGADDYVVKPFPRSEFVARLKSLLRRMQARGTPSIENGGDGAFLDFDGWRTDIDARRLLAPSGTELKLTKLEFDLWVTFLRATDRVLTRENLVFALRGRDWAGYDRSIDGLVSRLKRKMMEHADAEEYFETVRGVGYLLRTPACTRPHD